MFLELIVILLIFICNTVLSGILKVLMVFRKHKTVTRFIAAALTALTLTLTSTVPALAATYNCGAYGRGTYDNGTVCAATTDDGGLVNTGEKILPFAIPAVLILAGTGLLFYSRRRMKRNQPPQQ